MRANLIRSLRDEAVDESTPLARLLRRAKVLSSLLKNPRFKEWVRNETNGYDGDSTLPEYRMAVSPAHGTFVSSSARVSNVILPQYNLPEAVKPMALELNFPESVGELEALVEALEASAEENYRAFWPAEAVILARDSIQMGDGGRLVEAYQLVTPAMLARVLDAIRNRLLDFVLELEELDPKIAESEDHIQALSSGEVSRALNVTIYGNNNVVASGTGTTQNITIRANEALPVLDKIEEALRQDDSLPEKSRKESLEDLDLIRTEIGRERPRHVVLSSVLSHLGSVASIAGYVGQLQAMVEQS